MYQKQVPSYKHLDEPLDESRFVFECILPGNLEALPLLSVDPALSRSRDCTLHLFGLAFFLETLFLVTKINCSLLVTLIEKFHCTNLDQPKIN